MWPFSTVGAVNTEKKSKKKFCTQWHSQYFETFWCVTKITFHQNWNDVAFLLRNIIYKSWFTGYQMT